MFAYFLFTEYTNTVTSTLYFSHKKCTYCATETTQILIRAVYKTKHCSMLIQQQQKKTKASLLRPVVYYDLATGPHQHRMQYFLWPGSVGNIAWHGASIHCMHQWQCPHMPPP